MAASKLQMNWSAVGFTPTAGTLVVITKIQDVQYDPGASLKHYSGDADKYSTMVVSDISRPKMTVQSGDVATIQGLAPGTRGVFTATFLDAMLQTGGGIVYTLSNAVVGNTPGGGKHADYGGATLSIEAFSSDGVTNPLAFTRT